MTPIEPQDETASDTPARQRIAKLMARVGLCSRRDAETWIVEGRVSVNGELLTSPACDVGPDDTILVDGAPLPAAEKTRLFLFHKPRGLVTSDHDPEGRATVADFLRANWPDGPRVVTIGRLDINTEGLLLLTNDGGLARILELPKTGWVRRYRVRAKGETDQGVLDGLRDGVSIEGVDYAGIEAVLDRTQGANVWLTMALREGKNREVKRVLEHIGLEVNRLIRLSFGPFQLGDVPEGAVEEVRTRVLRDQLGTALAAAAGVTFEDAPPPAEAKPAHGPRKAPGDAGPRPPRPPARDDARRHPLGGERPPRRGREAPETPPPIRERPTAGTRKHVSALRAAGSETARRGPRRRIERSDVTDRKDRTVSVERLVGARPAPLAPTRARSGKPDRRDEPSGRDRGRVASPSALAKRARVAKSGVSSGAPDTGSREARTDRRRDDAPRRERTSDRPMRERTGPARRPRDDERREAAADGSAKRFGGRRDDAHASRRPQRLDAPRRPRDGEPREAAADGAAKRIGGRRDDAHTSRRPQRPAAPRRPRDGAARDDGAPKRFGGKPADAGAGRRPQREGRDERRSDNKRSDAKRSDLTGRAARGGRRSDAGDTRGAPRPGRGTTGGKPRGASGPRKPGGGKPPPRGKG